MNNVKTDFIPKYCDFVRKNNGQFKIWIFGFLAAHLNLSSTTDQKTTFFTAQIQAAALDGGVPVSGDGEAASDNEDTATKKGKKNRKSLKALGGSARAARAGSLKVTK